MASKLGLDCRVIREGQSTSFGFDVARADGGSFPFESLTYMASGTYARMGYCTFFPIGHVMRANMFVFRSAKDEWVRRMIKEPHDTLVDALPGLEKVLGVFTDPIKGETVGIDLWRTESFAIKERLRQHAEFLHVRLEQRMGPLVLVTDDQANFRVDFAGSHLGVVVLLGRGAKL